MRPDLTVTQRQRVERAICKSALSYTDMFALCSARIGGGAHGA